jgi:hypothetical protein
MEVRRCTTALVLGFAGFGLGGCGSLAFLRHRATPGAARTLTAFDTVEISGRLAVDVEVGGQPTLALAATTDAVSSRIDKGTLYLDTKAAGDPLSVQVTAPELRQLRVAGATVKVGGEAGPDLQIAVRDGGSVTVAAVTGGHLVVDAREHSRVTVAGAAETATFSLADGSRGDGRQLGVRTAKVSLSGASRLDLRPEQTVAGQAIGGSRLEVWSKPRRVKVATRGQSTVEYVR